MYCQYVICNRLPMYIELYRHRVDADLGLDGPMEKISHISSWMSGNPILHIYSFRDIRLHYITLHYKTIYSGQSRNCKVHIQRY